MSLTDLEPVYLSVPVQALNYDALEDLQQVLAESVYRNEDATPHMCDAVDTAVARIAKLLEMIDANSEPDTNPQSDAELPWAEAVA